MTGLGNVTPLTPSSLLLPVVGATLLFSACSSGPTTAPIPTPSVTAALPTGTSSTKAAPTEAAQAPSSAPAQPETEEAAAQAFKTWVKQYNAEEWDQHYLALVAEQQKLISAGRYAACRDKSVNPTFKWIKTVKTKADVMTSIPGTPRKAPATQVTVRLRVGGFTMPITAHMFYQDGAWRWSMTKENLKSCRK